MASLKKLPDGEVLIELAKSGLSNQEIAERYGVTAEAVRQALVKSDYRRERLRPSHAHYIPWRVQANHVGGHARPSAAGVLEAAAGPEANCIGGSACWTSGYSL